MSTFDEVMERLPELSPNELSKVKVALSTLAGAEESDDSNADIFWSQLRLVAADRGRLLSDSAFVKKRKSRWAEFVKSADAAAEALERMLKMETKTERVAVFRLAARALLSVMTSMENDFGYIITEDSIMRYATNTIAACKASWPGGGVEMAMAMGGGR